jgi:anti-sigma B factor antagonist
MKTMQIKQTIERDTARLAFNGDLLGEVDGVTVRSKIQDLVEGKVKHVIVDLGGVHHINSAGLGSLVAALITVRKSGGDIRLVRVCRNLQEIFTITRLAKIFDVHDTLEDARNAFRPPGRPSGGGKGRDRGRGA